MRPVFTIDYLCHLFKGYLKETYSINIWDDQFEINDTKRHGIVFIRVSSSIIKKTGMLDEVDFNKFIEHVRPAIIRIKFDYETIVASDIVTVTEVADFN